jgi:thiol-disulfide isomerase/thioredoxin
MRKRFFSALVTLLLGVAPTSVVWAQDAPEAKPAQEATPPANPSREIMSLIQTNKLEEAETKIDELPANSGMLKFSMRQMLASALARAGKGDRATAQNDKVLSELKEAIKEGNVFGEAAAMPLRALIQSKMASAKPEGAATWAREQINELVSMLPKKDDNSAVASEAAMEGILADFRASFDLPEETEKVEEQIGKLGDAVKSETVPLRRNMLLTTWINLRMSRINRKLESAADEASAETTALLNDVDSFGDVAQDEALFSQATRIRTGIAQRAMRVNPKFAKEQLEALNELLAKTTSDDSPVKRLADNTKRNVDRMLQSLEMELKRAELVGQNAMPLQADVFVNGTPITDEELKGKVVLLDFWAVWCGPCIATFPHLREWQEKYGDKGLVIIGVTNYYKYDWDDENKRIKSDKELTPENEQKAMVRFAEHHNLKHRFMVTPSGSTFSKDYAVSGIPQAVLIDKEGKIRMIKVGSGDANAHALDEMIKELLGAEGSAE